ncbi:MAG: DUF4136 domain-containing protein [Sphingomonadaceae bacterium]|nr:DUF4136 domain-containing protein [Sphingomonadaceae bacterium]
MSLVRRLLIPAAALLALGACAAPFRADVARFQQMPPPQGQSFYVQAADPAKAGGLEFETYANLVAIEMEQLGYRRAAGPESAELAVTLDYGVDNGRERIVTRPTAGYFGGFHDPWYWSHHWRSPYYWGWHDPWFDGFGTEIDSYTLYTSALELDITRTADGLALFDGRARARSSDDDLTMLVPNLVEAMFTGFPGNSGEEVRITIAPPEDDS